MDFSVVVAGREDDPGPDGALGVAAVADEMGYGELWIGEGPTWDAFALAVAVGLATQQAAITVGPVPVAVRDAATISRGAGSVAALTGRTVGVALGTSSVRVVEKLHGRSRAGTTAALADSAHTIRALMETTHPLVAANDSDAGFVSRLSRPNGPLTVAAFGERAIRVAADHADRMLLDLVSPEQVRALHSKLQAVAHQRPAPLLAAWLPAAIDPDELAHRQLSRSIAGYLTVDGYREMFEAAGFGAAVEKARSGVGRDDLVDLLPPEAAGIVGLVGGLEEVEDRLAAYSAAGLDEVALVPATAGDPGGRRTLSAFRRLG